MQTVRLVRALAIPSRIKSLGEAGPTVTPRLANSLEWIAFHVLSAIAVSGTGTEVLLGVPLWEQPRNMWAFFLGLAATHGAAAMALWWQAARGDRLSVRRVAATFLVAYALFALILVFIGSDYSPPVLVFSAILSILLLAASVSFISHLRWRLIPALGLALAAFFAAGVVLHRGPLQGALTRTPPKFIPSTFHTVRMSVSDRHFRSDVAGGSLTPLGRGFLVSAGNGSFSYLEELSSSDAPVVRRLPYRAPINHGEFRTDAPEAGHHRFRIGAILAMESGSRVRVVASHHYWLRESQCFVLRLSTMEADRQAFLDGTSDSEWTTVFETKPCLPIRAERRASEGPFSGHMLGGRMQALDERIVLLAVGDHAFDGLNSEMIVSQDPDGHYGKMIAIDVETGDWEVYSTGHRNPQGLWRSSDGTIWSTEHGPQGGDELNLVVRGANYGWPYETFGVQYGTRVWPLSAHQGRHTDYEAPVFAWLPSIAVSNLMVVEGDLFSMWRGDLLVSSLKGNLIRLRREAGRFVYAENLNIGRRIRDLAEAPDGRIVLLFDWGGMGILEPADDAGSGDGPRDGTLQFAACMGCHRFGNGKAHGIGPDLKGVFDREIASAEAFSYSDALRGLSGRWTDERMDRFLAAPREYVRGTTMEFAGVPDSTDRVLLIKYLRANN